LKDIFRNQISISPISYLKKHRINLRIYPKFQYRLKPSKISIFISIFNIVIIYKICYFLLQTYEIFKKYTIINLINTKKRILFIFLNKIILAIIHSIYWKIFFAIKFQFPQFPRFKNQNKCKKYIPNFQSNKNTRNFVIIYIF
jgi:hypothetical protein